MYLLSQPEMPGEKRCGGPRLCIGESFAWMEGVLLIAALAQRWRIQPGPRQRIALQPVITLRPKYGLEMRLERR